MNKMKKTILFILILCVLSTQVFGSIAYESDHNEHGEIHSLMHEFDQPHSHDLEDESQFTISYSDEAIEHINEDAKCCVIGVLEMSPMNLSERKPTNVVKFYANNWSPPLLKGVKPPPRNTLK